MIHVYDTSSVAGQKAFHAANVLAGFANKKQNVSNINTVIKTVTWDFFMQSFFILSHILSSLLSVAAISSARFFLLFFQLYLLPFSVILYGVILPQ